MRARRSLLITAAVTLSALGAAPHATPAVPSSNDGWFVAGPDFPGGPYRDVDVADINGDGQLDVFAPGHSFRPGLWENTGRGFTGNVVDRYGLGQDPEFPGWESGDSTTLGPPGLYVQRTARPGGGDEKATSLTFSWRSSGTESTDVRATMYAPTVAQQTVKAEVVITRTTDEDGRTVWVAAGTLQPGGLITLKANPGLPVDVTADQAVSPSEVFVGPELVHPDDRSFTLNAKDRHGLALADFMGDDQPDALWAVGGMKDQAKAFAGLIDDQVFVNEDGVEQELGPSSGVTKTTCRGYQSRVLDADRNGALDLFVGCSGDRPKLWYQTSPGRFSSQRLSGVSDSVLGARWLDLDNDGALELVTTTGRQLAVYQRTRGDYVQVQSLPIGVGAGGADSIQVADYDGDGFQDVLVPSKDGSALFDNVDGTLRRVGLSSLGLPGSMVGAAWADVDSDGLTDLLAMPGGLYLQSADGFERSGVLSNLTPSKYAIASFADFDNNGSRDIVADLDGELSYVASNVAPQGRWLAVDLTGPDGNASALGAFVTVEAGSSTQRHWVGESDGSVYSQGHYRLYFGLGDSNLADMVTVTWPDGSTTSLRDVSTNRRLEIAQP